MYKIYNRTYDDFEYPEWIDLIRKKTKMKA